VCFWHYVLITREHLLLKLLHSLSDSHDEWRGHVVRSDECLLSYVKVNLIGVPIRSSLKYTNHSKCYIRLCVCFWHYVLITREHLLLKLLHSLSRQILCWKSLIRCIYRNKSRLKCLFFFKFLSISPGETGQSKISLTFLF
jgi:hypothetical protein